MASDLSTAYRIKEIPHDAVKSLEGIKNLATNRLLHAGDILRKRDLTKAKLIKRGELVMVEAKSNNFQIVNEAIAFQDGYFGDQIKLTSVDTKKPINARVIGKGKVRTLSKQWIIK
jgi:flagella basal body P-ring formation protein FlgA